MNPDPRAKPVPLLWDTLITAWAEWLTASGFSPATITTRTDHVQRCARAISGDPRNVAPEALIHWFASQDWSPETRRSVRASLRNFYGWCHAHGHTPENPALELPTVTQSHRKLPPAPEHSYRLALAHATDRERLMLRLGAEAGLRRAEIAQVHQRDILVDLTGWSLTVHGKGAKDRVVPLNGSLGRELHARILDVGGGFAFPGKCAGHLAPATVGDLVSALLPPGVTAHSLRRRFASRVFAVDHDIIATSELLGHSSIATTQAYVWTDEAAGRRLVEAVA